MPTIEGVIVQHEMAADELTKALGLGEPDGKDITKGER
jgi:hypothetical protein